MIKSAALYLVLTFALAMPVMAQQPSQATAKDDTVVEEIVARVNNSIVTREDLRKSRDQMRQEVQQQQQQQPGTDGAAMLTEREKNLLRDLIDQQLLVQKGTDLGISVDTDLIKRLDELRKEMKVDSMEELEKMAGSQGVSFEDFKTNMKNNLMTQKVISSEVGGHLQFTKDELQKYYEEHKAEFDQPEHIRLAEILIPAAPAPAAPKDPKDKPLPPIEATPEQIAAAQVRADEALAKLKAGAKFSDVAKEYSAGPTADEGGDLGYFKRGVLDKALEDTTFALKDQQTTDVIRTKQGFVILKVVEHTPAGLQPFSRVENRIQEVLYFQKMEPALRAYLTKLREDAYIDIKPGYVDSAASPNQTKLIYTSAPETKGKALKKKKHKHFIFF